MRGWICSGHLGKEAELKFTPQASQSNLRLGDSGWGWGGGSTTAVKWAFILRFVKWRVDRDYCFVSSLFKLVIVGYILLLFGATSVQLAARCLLYEGVSRSFRTGRLARELQMVQLSATRCSCVGILWVSLVSFAAITLCVASQRVTPKVSLCFVIDSVRKLFDTPSYDLFRSLKWGTEEIHGAPKWSTIRSPAAIAQSV
jgi:hypothetical protein